MFLFLRMGPTIRSSRSSPHHPIAGPVVPLSINSWVDSNLYQSTYLVVPCLMFSSSLVWTKRSPWRPWCHARDGEMKMVDSCLPVGNHWIVPCVLIWLVVEPCPSEKYEFVCWYYMDYMESQKIPWFQSPPTSNPSHISHDLVHGHPIDSPDESRHPRHRCRDRSRDVEHTPVAIDALGHQSNQQHSCFNGWYMLWRCLKIGDT